MIAFHANLNRDKKKRSKPFTPDEFNPFTPRKRQTLADFGRLVGLSDYQARKKAGEL